MGTSVERNKVDREALRRLARARVVTTRDLAKLLNTSPSSAKKVAFRLRKSGFLKAVRRGEYASVPFDVDPARFQPDPYLAVRKALGNRYAFSHYSALALLGAEQQVRRGIHVEAPGARPRRRSVGEIPVHVHASPLREWKEVTTKVRRGGVPLLVTTAARTLVALASLPGPAQDYEGALGAFRSLLPRVDPSDLTRAGRLVTSAAARARLGHYLRRALREIPESGDFTPFLSDLKRSLGHAGPVYVGTRPRSPNNRFDAEFKVVYPGGV